MAESKSSFINQILDSFARDLGFKNRLSEMGGNINNTFKDMRNTLNSMSLDGVRKFLQENVHGGSSVSSASAAEKRVKKVFKDYAPLSKKELPKGKGGTETLFSLGKSRSDKGSSAVRTKGSAGARDRANIKTAISLKRKSSVKDVAPLGGSSYKIKSGDTLSAIARKNNTTVAALMKMNPKIKDKDKIRAGQFIKVGSPTRATAKTKSVKGIRDFATSIAEAKRRGLTEYKDIKTGRMKAAVTADELKKSGLSLRAYLNKMKKKKK